MDNKDNQQPDGPEQGNPESAARRRVLMIGAATATTVLSVRPALAQSAASVLNCKIPVPDVAAKAVAPDGSLVPQGTQGAFPGGQTFRGEDVKNALRGRTLPGTSYSQSQAYINYIRRLQYGRSGFTCYASLQMPR
jgi:hypothetical protein